MPIHMVAQIIFVYGRPNSVSGDAAKWLGKEWTHDWVRAIIVLQTWYSFDHKTHIYDVDVHAATSSEAQVTFSQ